MILDDTATALYGTLTGGTALTALLAGTTSVYWQQAPDNASYGFVVYNHQGGGPDNDSPGKHESNIWQVRAYSATGPKQAALILTQADLLINQKSISIGGSACYWCAREANINLVENLPSGKKVWSAGGLYRIRTSG